MSGHEIDRSRFFKEAAKLGVLVTGAPAFLAACGGSSNGGSSSAAAPAASSAAGPSGSKEMVYSTWGGSWQDALDKAWVKPFTQASGIKVTFTGTPDYGKIEAMVDNHSTNWDVAEINPDFATIGEKKNLLEPIDYSVVSLNGVTAGLNTKFAVPQLLWSMVITHRTDKFDGKNLTSWADVWDTKQFPGKRTFDKTANGGVFEAALLADGVPADQVYPIDVDRAFKKLDEIKSDILWFETGSQMTQWYSDGSAVAGIGWDGRINALVDQKIPVRLDWNQSLLTYSMMCVPKGAPHKDAAMKFLNYALTAKAQASAAEAISYGPVNTNAFPLIPPNVAERLSGNPTQVPVAVKFNAAWWAENLDAVQQKLEAYRTS